MNNKLTEKPKQSKGKSFPHLQILDSTIRASAELSTAAFRVYIILRFHHHRETGTCNPSVPTIRKEANLSKKTVERALNELESLGWIFRKTNKGFKKPNNYSFPESAITIKNPSIEQQPSASEMPPPPVAAAPASRSQNRQWIKLDASEELMSIKDFVTHLQELYPKKNVRQIAAKLKNFCEQKNLDLTLERLKGWVDAEKETVDLPSDITNLSKTARSYETTHERRDREARQRIEFSEAAERLLEAEGIIQTDGS
jgi:hypothetical protein